jgi:hypothetical protein
LAAAVEVVEREESIHPGVLRFFSLDASCGLYQLNGF